jgi:cupin fold WbuC family metalloprotein
VTFARRGYRAESDEVLYSDARITPVTRAEIEALETRAAANPRRRVRLCAHESPASALHEMLIIHERDAYVRPHRHVGKGESLHVVKGRVDLVLFADAGAIDAVIELGDYASGKTFYIRLDEPVFHTFVIRSDVLVFHETTKGPFDRAATEFAPWAPDGSDAREVERYMTALRGTIDTPQSATP